MEVSYRVYGAAAEMMNSRAPEIMLAGPAGTGKSRACMIKIHLTMMKYRKAKTLVVRKTQKSLSASFIEEFEDVIKEALDSGMVTFFGGSVRKPAQYQYSNGATVTLGGLDDPVKIMSTQYDLVYAQEATQLFEVDWNSLNTRLRNGRTSRALLMGDCNPDAETHWLKQRANRGDLLMLHSVHKDNPRYFNRDGTPTEEGAAYLARLHKLTGVFRERMLFGRWASAEGAIFEDFDPSIHLISLGERQLVFGKDTPLCKAGLPWSWPRYWAIDFGYVNPFVLQRWAEMPDGELLLYGEIYMTHRLVREHAQDVLNQVTRMGTKEDGNEGKRVWLEPKPQAIVTDHDAEGRADFESVVGMPTTAADKAVLEGLQDVQARFKDARLFLLRDALVERDQILAAQSLPTCTIEEVPGYIWDQAKEKPVKANDHGMDPMRYVVRHRDKGRSKYIRWVR